MLLAVAYRFSEPDSPRSGIVIDFWRCVGGDAMESCELACSVPLAWATAPGAAAATRRASSLLLQVMPLRLLECAAGLVVHGEASNGTHHFAIIPALAQQLAALRPCDAVEAFHLSVVVPHACHVRLVPLDRQGHFALVLHRDDSICALFVRVERKRRPESCEALASDLMRRCSATEASAEAGEQQSEAAAARSAQQARQREDDGFHDGCSWMRSVEWTRTPFAGRSARPPAARPADAGGASADSAAAAAAGADAAAAPLTLCVDVLRSTHFDSELIAARLLRSRSLPATAQRWSLERFDLRVVAAHSRATFPADAPRNAASRALAKADSALAVVVVAVLCVSLLVLVPRPAGERGPAPMVQKRRFWTRMLVMELEKETVGSLQIPQTLAATLNRPGGMVETDTARRAAMVAAAFRARLMLPQGPRTAVRRELSNVPFLRDVSLSRIDNPVFPLSLVH